MIYAIPSKGRPNKIKTLHLIDDEVYIFVEPQEYNSYSLSYSKKARIINIQKTNQGIAYVRNFIMEYFKNEDCICMLDDDIQEFQKRLTEKTESGFYKMKKMESEEIKMMFDKLKSDFKKYDLTQATISFAPSNWMYEKKYKSPSRVWCFNIINPKKCLENNIIYDNDAALFEDYDITAQIISKGLKNICFYDYAFLTSDGCGGQEGGCQCFRTPESSLSVVQYLTYKWGTAIVKSKFVEKKNMMEISFKWKLLQKYAQK